MRTWHDVVEAILKDPKTGRFRRDGRVHALLKASKIRQSTFFRLLRDRASPRGEIDFVTRLAKALGIEPFRLLLPDEGEAPSRQLVAAAEFSSRMIPNERRRLLDALSNPEEVAYLLSALTLKDHASEAAHLGSTAPARSRPRK